MKMSKPKICFIVGAGEFGDVSARRFLNDYDCASDFVIAADGGYNHLQKIGVTPDVVVGDFDSISGNIDKKINAERYPKEKNETDTELAINIALEKDYRNVRFYGILGGRLSHTLANLQNIARLAEKKIKPVITGETCFVYILHNDTVMFSEESRGYVSVFAHTDEAKVKISGLKYELDATLYNNRPLGVSNEFAGKTGIIEVKYGTVIIVTECESA
jgi:thiamine pyrophosphokinase